MDEQRDFAEEAYNRDMCPLCETSPCLGGSGKGSCDEDEREMQREMSSCEDDSQLWREEFGWDRASF